MTFEFATATQVVFGRGSAKHCAEILQPGGGVSQRGLVPKTMLDDGCKRLGEVQCLLKPFSLEDFRAKVGVLTGEWKTQSTPVN